MSKNLRLFFSFLLMTAFTAGVASTAALAAEEKKPVKQDPALVISLEELASLVDKGPEEGNYQLIDARPEIKFSAGSIPSSINIPKPLLPQNLDKLAKDRMLIFYCGGTACKLSPQSAEIAMQNGFTNVKVFYEGMPAWIKGGNYKIVELDHVRKQVMEGGQEPFLLIDARPAVKYQKAFIPGAISLPKAEFELKKGMLPADKSIPLVFYCGGYTCNLSHKSARAALEIGYTDVAVFAAGEPVWRDAGLPLWGNESSGVVAKVKKEGLPETISPEEFTKLASSGTIQIVDVRDPEDFAKGHIPGSINVFDEDFIFKQQESIAKLATDRRIVLVCTTGARSGSSYYAILDAPDFPNKGQVQYLDTEVAYMADGSFVFAQK
ncbi:MAG: rhodanese-like domain-containing protein [Desulfuromonadales bacterium]|nr:rhodanese-like domain-containing protein [Desulfuromonadales bacterium]